MPALPGEARRLKLEMKDMSASIGGTWDEPDRLESDGA